MEQLVASIQSVKLEIFKKDGNGMEWSIGMFYGDILDILLGSTRANFSSNSDPNISYRKLSKTPRPRAEKGLSNLKPLKLGTIRRVFIIYLYYIYIIIILWFICLFVCLFVFCLFVCLFVFFLIFFF
jgi:hypothetical protein